MARRRNSISPALVKLTAVHVLALGCFGVAMGEWLRRRIPILERWLIPAPICGGMVYALIAYALRDRWVNFEIDTVLRDLLMIVFFTTVGLGARWTLVKLGGIQVLLLLALSTAGAVLQSILGIALAKAFGINPLVGVMSSAVALAGGPATSLAFGSTFEKLGVPGAATIGVASATFGIVAAGLFCGLIGGLLIKRHGLTPDPSAKPTNATPEAESGTLMGAVITTAIAMGLGSLVSAAVERTGIVLPGYIGSMVVGAVIVNARLARPAQVHLQTLGSVSLQIFIVMALMTLKLWELANLALPLIGMLLAQTVLVWVMCLWLVYRVMGRDYEAAVMTAGFAGYMLGTTANAVAGMRELEERYGLAPRSFLVVPIVGAFLIDFTNSLVITAFANWLR
ncbi:MAG: sodium/glutamate symporter [Bryobacteraceae bacterium]